jgi:DNA adenine methylase
VTARRAPGPAKNGSTRQRLDLASLTERAASTLSATPRPFLRWAGSKRAYLSQIVSALPDHIGTYWEPFLGSGSLFFLLNAERAVLSDASAPLVGTYRAVRDGPSAVMRYLRDMPVNRESYYRIRAAHYPNRFQRAARFIYLNKTCWNGLYRVNSRGEFNVPYGSPSSSPKLADIDNLKACSVALQGVGLYAQDFSLIESDVEEGDLVYLDPPYVTRHNNNGFVDYNEKLFSWADQERLARLAASILDRGATVVVSNADHLDVRHLYPRFRAVTFSRNSTLASDGAKRGRVIEALYLGSPR